MQNESSNRQEVRPADIFQPQGGDDMRLMRAEVDIQIATAKRFPRSIQKVVATAEGMATLTPETAASCFYKLPKRGEDGKPIEGPSVRLAEIIATCWTNLRVAGRICGEDGRFVTAQGACWDLESNVGTTQDVRRRITNREGRRYSDDMIAVTANAAVSIAVRNAIIRVVPRVFVDSILGKCKKVAVGDAKTLEQRRVELLQYLTQKMGVSEAQVLHAVEREKAGDITLADMETLHGLATAVRDGEISLDEAFPPIVREDQDKKSEGDKSGGEKAKEQAKSPNDKLAQEINQKVAGSAPGAAQGVAEGDVPFNTDSSDNGGSAAPGGPTGQSSKPPTKTNWMRFMDEAAELAKAANIDVEIFDTAMKKLKAGKGWVGKEDSVTDAMLAPVREST